MIGFVLRGVSKEITNYKSRLIDTACGQSGRRYLSQIRQSFKDRDKGAR